MTNHVTIHELRFLEVAQLARADWKHYRADKTDLITEV